MAVACSGWAYASDQGSLQRFTFTEYLMGIDARIVLYAKDQVTAQEACSAAFERVAALETVMSDYRKDSELMKLCDKAGTGPVPISDDLYRVLERSQEVSQRSNGMFDVTVGPVVRLWRAARKSGKLPTQAEIDAARKFVGWKKLRLDAKHKSASLAVPGMRLDLGAIGKGFADDEAQSVLKAHGITSALIEMGGDIVVTDPPPGKRGWAIEVPNAATVKGIPTLELSNVAISSSGDTEQFVIIGGKKYSHVIDPHTGWALSKGVQATIIAKDGLTSDSVSTALTLLNEKGRALLVKSYPGTSIYMRIIRNPE